MTTSVLDRQFEEHMREAVQLSTAHVENGGIPFAALVVHPRFGVIGTGVNRVAEDNDPTAHAEVVALRDACANQGTFSLAGCTLLASGEPCALCYMVTLYSGVKRIRYAIDRDGAAQAGFDYSGSYSIFASQPSTWSLDARALPVDGGQEPFNRWQERRRG